MPTYEYQCKDCKEVFEAVQRMSEAPLSECPKCHGKSVQKLISATSFQLKGSGWYKTDYASGNSSTAPASSAKNDVTPKAESSPATPSSPSPSSVTSPSVPSVEKKSN